MLDDKALKTICGSFSSQRWWMGLGSERSEVTFFYNKPQRLNRAACEWLWSVKNVGELWHAKNLSTICQKYPLMNKRWLDCTYANFITDRSNNKLFCMITMSPLTQLKKWSPVIPLCGEERRALRQLNYSRPAHFLPTDISFMNWENIWTAKLSNSVQILLHQSLFDSKII